MSCQILGAVIKFSPLIKHSIRGQVSRKKDTLIGLKPFVTRFFFYRAAARPQDYALSITRKHYNHSYDDDFFYGVVDLSDRVPDNAGGHTGSHDLELELTARKG